MIEHKGYHAPLFDALQMDVDRTGARLAAKGDDAGAAAGGGADAAAGGSGSGDGSGGGGAQRGEGGSK